MSVLAVIRCNCNALCVLWKVILNVAITHTHTHTHTLIKITHQTYMNKNIKDDTTKTVVDQDSTLMVKYKYTEEVRS